MTEWIKCSERLPKTNGDKLASDGTSVWTIPYKWHNEKGNKLGFGLFLTQTPPYCKEITHWAELPAPPIELSENDKILIEEVQRNVDCFARGVALGRQALGLLEVPND